MRFLLRRDVLWRGVRVVFCEDLDDEESLQLLCHILNAIVGLNDATLFEVIGSVSTFVGAYEAGCVLVRRGLVALIFHFVHGGGMCLRWGGESVRFLWKDTGCVSERERG